MILLLAYILFALIIKTMFVVVDLERRTLIVRQGRRRSEIVARVVYLYGIVLLIIQQLTLATLLFLLHFRMNIIV